MRRNTSLIVLTAVMGLFVAGAAADERGREARRTPVVEVFEKCRDAVVNISTTRTVRVRSLGPGSLFDDMFNFGPRGRDRQVQSVGSGVVVHESGYVVTNAHVVAQASDVRITSADGRTEPAEVVAVDQEHDLAVLRLAARGPRPHLPMGRSNDIMIGETVVAIGNPLGLQHTVTTGIISALDREIAFSQDVVYRGLIQTDAPINPGNSGGPLLNINGELIGINTAIRGDAQNIGFAIPVDHLWDLLPRLLDIERRQRVRFGVQLGGADTRVVAVRPETPAAQAGLRPGDRVVALNDQPLRDGIDYYVHLLGQQPGSAVKLRIARGDEQLDVQVPLESIPLPDGAKLAGALFGMTLQEIPREWYRRYDLPDYAGLVVTEVERGSPADRAGMLPTDLLLRLDGIPVMKLNDVGLVLEQVRRGDAVRIEGLRIDADPPFFWNVRLPAR